MLKQDLSIYPSANATELLFKVYMTKFFISLLGKAFRRMKNGVYFIVIDLFSLYVLFSHFRPRDATLGNSFFQRLSYACAHVRTN